MAGHSSRRGGSRELGDLPVQIAVHPSEPILAILHAGYGEHEVVTVDGDSGKIIGRVSLPASFAGLVWSADGKRLFAGGGFDDRIYRFDHADGLLSNKTVFEYPDRKAFHGEANPEDGDRAKKAQRVPAGLAITKDGKTLYVAAAFGHSVGRFDAETGAFQGELALEADSYPYGLALDESRKQLYVSLWSKAKVAVVNTDTLKLVGQWTTEEHPNEMLLASGGKILYVANANRNTVSVIDTEAGKPIETIGTAIDPKAPSGQYAQFAGTLARRIDSVGRERQHQQPGGRQRQGSRWQRTARLHPGRLVSHLGATRSRRQDHLRGQWQGSELAGQSRRSTPGIPRPAQPDPRVHRRALPGHALDHPDADRRVRWRPILKPSTSAARCDGAIPPPFTGPSPAPGHPIPAKVGEPSPIKYVIYIVKENRTYDQVFGDMKEGNGDPNLCLFPEAITPNHHALVREFVLLDNFYVDSEVSADGHEWSMGAYATDFVERIWPLGYRGDRRVPYPSEGAFDEWPGRPAAISGTRPPRRG